MDLTERVSIMSAGKSKKLAMHLDEYFHLKEQEDSIKEKMELLRAAIFPLMKNPTDLNIEVIASGLNQPIEAVKYLKQNTVVRKKKVFEFLGEKKFRKMAKIVLTDLKNEVTGKEYESLITKNWDTEPSLTIRKIKEKKKN